MKENPNLIQEREDWKAWLWKTDGDTETFKLPNADEVADWWINRNKQTIHLLLSEIIKRIEEGKEEWPYKENKKTGELDFGKYPSSICRSCGQKRCSELQGNNQALDHSIAIIKEYMK